MKKFTLLFFSYFILQFCYSQNVGIGTGSPDSSSILEINSNNKGILIPRTDTTTVNAAGLPAKSLLIYQNSDSTFYYYDGSRWRAIVYGTSGASGTNNINIQMFDEPGTYNFTIPYGVTKIIVEVWGAGGGGGPVCSGCSSVGPGGGGGGYGKGFFNVVPGTTYSIIVGAGGLGRGCSAGNTPPIAGGTSSFGNLIFSTGGNSGSYMLSGAGYLAGSGGKSNGNYISFNGNSGGSGGQSGIVSGGDAGAAGGTGATDMSQNGKFPGGGGAAGNYGTNCPIVGGDGASGRVIVSW